MKYKIIGFVAGLLFILAYELLMVYVPYAGRLFGAVAVGVCAGNITYAIGQKHN